MDLNAHWYEFGSLSQFLSPEKRRVFRRINFEYLLLFNQRSTEAVQAIIWNGIQSNLGQLQDVATHAGPDWQLNSASTTAPTPTDIAHQQVGEQKGVIDNPIQVIDILPKADQTPSLLPLSGRAISHEVFRQAIDDIREAINGDKDHSKWLLIASFKQLHKALELDPDNYHAHFIIAWLSTCFFKKQEQAIRHLDAVVQGAFEKETPFAIFALRHKAEVYRELGNFDAAVEATNDAYMLDRQQTPQIIFDLARYLTLAEQHEKAVHFLEALLEQYPVYYWQVLAEPDFSKNQEVTALTHALAKTYLGLDSILSAEPSETLFDESELAELLEENERINLEDAAFLPADIEIISSRLSEINDDEQPVAPGETEQPIVVRQTDSKKPSPTDKPLANGHSTDADDVASNAHPEPAPVDESPTPTAEAIEVKDNEDTQPKEQPKTETAASEDANVIDSDVASISARDVKVADPETGNVDEDTQQLEKMLNEVESIVEQESQKTDHADSPASPEPPQKDMSEALDNKMYIDTSSTVAVRATSEDRAEIMSLLQQIGENLNLSPSAETTTAPDSPPAETSAFPPTEVDPPQESEPATEEDQQDAQLKATAPEKSNAADPESTVPITATLETDTAQEAEDVENLIADTDREDKYETNDILAKMGKKILVEPPEKSWPNPFKVQEPLETPVEPSPTPETDETALPTSDLLKSETDETALPTSDLLKSETDETALPMSDLLMKVEENARRSATAPPAQQTSNDRLTPATGENPPATENGQKIGPAGQPEMLADIIAELHQEAELAFQRCEKLDTVFTRKDKERTQDKIQKMVEKTIRELPPLGEMERQELLKMSRQRIHQTTERFLNRHKLVGKLKGNGS